MPNSGRLCAAVHELLHIVGQELDVFPGTIFQHEGVTPGRADTGNRRWREGKGNPVG